jgi:hypothetical protein
MVVVIFVVEPTLVDVFVLKILVDVTSIAKIFFLF